MKPLVDRKLAVGVGQLVFWLLETFQVLTCMVYKHAVAAAFHIYAQCGEDAAKSEAWRLCIK